MAVVVESIPSTQPSINQKSDVQAVPTGQEDLWVDAGDMNVLGQTSTSLVRAVRLQALIAAVAPATAGINGKAFRLTGIDSILGLAAITPSMPTDLNKKWALAMEKVEEGGDLDGTASASAFFAVGNGLVTLSTTFVSNTQLAFSAGGGLVTYPGGTLPPIGIVTTNTSYAHIDPGGRFSVDGTSLSFSPLGVLGVIPNGTAVDFFDLNNVLVSRVF